MKYMIQILVGLGVVDKGGGSKSEILGTKFEITGDPKAPLHGPTFWSGFEAPDP